MSSPVNTHISKSDSTRKPIRPSERASYSPLQLHLVYDRISLPSKFRYEPGEFSKEVIRHRDGFNFLGALQTYMLTSVPFENLELHYSSHHQISIHPDALFNKIISQGKGRGGYGMELNVFLGTVLRSLGFEVMSVGARINSATMPTGDVQGEAKFGGWSHMVNLVTIRGETYMVDVGFGSGGPTVPLSLKEGGVTLNVPPEENVRLRYDNIPENESPKAKLWLLERRLAEGEPWTSVYCFADDVCFLPQDLEVINHFASSHRTSRLTYEVVASKHLLDDSGIRLIGDVVCYQRELHRRKLGVKEILATFTTEQERVDALSEHLGIALCESQREGIVGMSTEIRQHR